MEYNRMEWKIIQGFLKKSMKRLSFITQFIIEFLLPFIGCRKVIGKMPANRRQLPDLQLLHLNSNCQVSDCKQDSEGSLLATPVASSFTEKWRASKWESRMAIFFFHDPLDVFEVRDLKEGEFFLTEQWAKKYLPSGSAVGIAQASSSTTQKSCIVPSKLNNWCFSQI